MVEYVRGNSFDFSEKTVTFEGSYQGATPLVPSYFRGQKSLVPYSKRLLAADSQTAL